MTSILRISRLLRREDGVALPVVFGLGMVMLMLVATAMTITTRGLMKTNTDEDFNGALAAAYAGVEEYQARLSNDATYTAYGNPASPFTGTSPVVMPGVVNKAFGVGANGTWADIPGEIDPATGVSTPSGASFRYEVNTADYADKGVLHLRSTGRVGDVTRSIVADLKQDGFIDYLYFTNYEQPDPEYIGQTTLDADGKNVCERYAYGSPARDNSNNVVKTNGTIHPTGCNGAIQFGSADKLTGPVRSNDQLLVACGSKFTSTVTSASPTPIKYASGSCSPSPFSQTPTSSIIIDMPPTNSDMKRETRTDLTDIPRPGCLYTGPTVITFLSGGNMNVYSPWTKATQTTATTGSSPAMCGTPGSASGSLGGPNGATIPVLARNLIFVQAVPPAGTSDPNSPVNAGYLPPGFTCVSATGSGEFQTRTPAGWTFKDGATVKWAFPMAQETMPAGGVVGVGLTNYGCRNADAYVKGTLTGQMTIAADNYIYVIDNLKYSSRSTDVLGLVANRAIFVWNPVKYSGGSNCEKTDNTNTCTWSALNGMSGANREVDAAMLSVGHTFQVQNYSRVDNGTLTVFGAIAQKFRGSVGTSGGAGFTKDYQYDTRFRNIAPPKFLTPVSTTYGVTQTATVPAAFKPDGSVIPSP